MDVKISFADFLSIYDNLTFKNRENKRTWWFCILNFVSIWRSFEATRRCFYAPRFFLVATKKYGESYCICNGSSCGHDFLRKELDYADFSDTLNMF